MGAHVSFESSHGFIMDEERLRNIHDIIFNRLGKEGKDNKFKPKYTIYRSDNFVYNTLDIEDILREENSELKKIIRLKITPEQNIQTFNFALEFKIKTGFSLVGEPNTTLDVEGEDRDLVYLFFSELKKYLTIEVNTKRIITINTLNFIRYIPMLLLMILPSISILLNGTKNDLGLKNALNSQDIPIKLNYLINQTKGFNAFSSYNMYFLLIPFLIILSFSDQFEISMNKILSQYVFPSNLFLLGKECSRYNKILDLRSKIIWGIMVALIISILGSIIVWKITG